MKLLKLLDIRQKQVPVQCEFDEDLAIEFKKHLKKRGVTIRNAMEIFARQFIKESKESK